MIKFSGGDFMQKNVVRGYLMVIASAVIYGCMPLMAKYIYADGVTPTTLVFLRNLLALPSLGVLALIQSKTLKTDIKKIPYISLLAAFGCCITPLLLFSSYNHIASGTATVIHFIYPAAVVVGVWLVSKKRPAASVLLSVLLCVVGIALFYNPSEAFNLKGGLLALMSGFTFAFYIILLQRFDNSRIKGFLFSFYIALSSAVIMLVFALATSTLALPQTLAGWGLCLLFATAVTTGAVVLFQQGTFIIGGERASILSTLEPITSLIIGFAIFNEALGVRSIVGSVLVILASILIAAKK